MNPRLSPGELRRRCEPASLGFRTTDELPDLESLIGQERATAALDFGTALRAPDYNVFAIGPPRSREHESLGWQPSTSRSSCSSSVSRRSSLA